MTAQATDTVLYRGEPYGLVGGDGPGLFEAAQYGLQPVAISTGNWRGYLCTYEVSDGWLRLCNVSVGLGAEARAAIERGEGPILFGISPILAEGGCSADYRGLDCVMPYSGNLLLGADFVWDVYVHMGFHPPWKCRRVHELTFEAGRLTGEADRSTDMARLREAAANGGLAALFKPLSPAP
jgi:hypothetical protein